MLRPFRPTTDLGNSRALGLARDDSINAATSASSNNTRRALILWRTILPALAHRKTVRGQMPNRLAMDLALLNLRPVMPSGSAANSAGDSLDFIMERSVEVPWPKRVRWFANAPLIPLELGVQHSQLSAFSAKFAPKFALHSSNEEAKRGKLSEAVSVWVWHVVEEIRQTGVNTLQGIADCLNRRGIPTRTGKSCWYPSTVSSLRYPSRHARAVVRPPAPCSQCHARHPACLAGLHQEGRTAHRNRPVLCRR